MPRSLFLLPGGCALLAALLYGCSTLPRDEPAAPPETNRFTRDVLVEGLDEPMALEFDRAGRVYWIERKGNVQRYDEATGQLALLGTIPVDAQGEAGLLGLLLAPDFDTSRHLYLYYSATGAEREARLARFTLDAGDRIDPASEVVLLRWPHEVASHMGGGMAWDADGNLYLSTGDNSDATQYTPIHWTNPEGHGQDAQRSSANTNDLRGKILRIHPEPDGSYTIPEGNLFPPGTEATRPEIYTMGNRNPWRLSIDAETGYLHWGEVGPDAGSDSAGIGPRGYDEFNVARQAGNFGWPYFIGTNLPYHTYDYDTGTYGPPFDPERPVNPSPNNTGLRELPPARPALLAYPYGTSEAFPILNSGGRNAVGGPVFHTADFGPEAERVFPSYYEGKWFVVDFVRTWVMVLTLDAARTAVVSVERFLPDERYSSPIDMDFGPQGDLYLLEYGTQWFQQNADARLSRISYNAGNRPPVVRVVADRPAGAVPFGVRLSSEGTLDPDGDSLRYEWVVTPRAGGATQRFTDAHPTLTFDEPGIYQVALIATDPSGAAADDNLVLVAGNEPPDVALSVENGNASFYFPGRSVAYRVAANDREDGSLDDGGIAADDVRVTAEYVPAGMSPEEAARAGHLPPGAPMRHLRALQVMAGSDCSTCHTVEAASAGPAFRDIAARYRDRDDAVAYLSQKIITGGSGVWGPTAMPAHPALPPAETATVAAYILSLARPEAAPRDLPAQGRYLTEGHTMPSPLDGRQVPQPGAYVLRATYTDRGAGGVAPLTATDVVLLRYPRLAPETADDISDDISYTPSRDPGFIITGDGAYVGFEDLDLTGIGRIDVHTLTRFYTWSHFTGAGIEVRLDAPTGPLVGAPALKTPIDTGSGRDQPGLQSDADSRGAPAKPVFLDGEPPVSISVDGASGRHDVYVVFTNADAGPEDALLLLTGIEFVPTAPPTTPGTPD